KRVGRGGSLRVNTTPPPVDSPLRPAGRRRKPRPPTAAPPRRISAPAGRRTAATIPVQAGLGLHPTTTGSRIVQQRHVCQTCPIARPLACCRRVRDGPLAGILRRRGPPPRGRRVPSSSFAPTQVTPPRSFSRCTPSSRRR